MLPYLDVALEAFGPERCMFASDWPVSLLNTTYQGWMSTVIGRAEELTPRERTASSVKTPSASTA